MINTSLFSLSGESRRSALDVSGGSLGLRHFRASSGPQGVDGGYRTHDGQQSDGDVGDADGPGRVGIGHQEIADRLVWLSGEDGIALHAEHIRHKVEDRSNR